MRRPPHAIGVALLTLTLVSLAGCPTTPAPVDLGDPLVLPDGGRSYLRDVLLDGQLMRWTRSVITVSVDVSRAPTDWQPMLHGFVLDGLNQWQAAAAGAFTFQLVAADADITIQYVASIPSQAGLTAGNTRIAFGYNTFSRPVIDLALYDLTEVQLHASAIHEIGHALGIIGHSPNPNDMMTMGTYETRLSSNDIATLLDLYGRTPWYTEE